MKYCNKELILRRNFKGGSIDSQESFNFRGFCVPWPMLVVPARNV